MTSPETQSIQWSEDKYKTLSSQLQGFWAQDVWDRRECPLTKDIIAFPGLVRYS